MKKNLFSLLTFLFTVIQVVAQSSDAMVIGGQQKGDANSTLEVISKNGTKGFMPPRFTTAQATTLKTSLTAVSKGLIIYDTDENCIKTWLGDKWSECLGTGTSEAKLTYNCSSSIIKGTYNTDKPVTSNEFMELSVIVNKPGPYNFFTETKNGVRFALNAAFTQASATPQIIQIPAIGTPLAEGTFTYSLYDQLGMPVCSGNTNFKTDVTDQKATYTINCSQTTVLGNFIEGESVSNQKLVLKVAVTAAGTYYIKTNTINGVTFEGSGTVSTSTSEITIPAKAGTPTWNSATAGLLTFPLLDKAGTSLGCSASVQIFAVKGEFTVTSCNYTLDGAHIASDLPYLISGDDLSKCAVRVKVNVTKPGPYNFRCDGASFSDYGISFLPTNTMFFANTGPQEVIMQGSGIFNYPATENQGIFMGYGVTNYNTSICPGNSGNIGVATTWASFTPSALTINASSASAFSGYTTNQVVSKTVYIEGFKIKTKGPAKITGYANGLTFTSSIAILESVGTIINAKFNVTGNVLSTGLGSITVPIYSDGTFIGNVIIPFP